MSDTIPVDNAASPASSRMEPAVPANHFCPKSTIAVTLSEHFIRAESASTRELPAASATPASPIGAPAKKDWNALLSRMRQQRQHTAPSGGPAPTRLSSRVNPGTIRPIEIREDLLSALGADAAPRRAESGLSEVPAGFHDGFVLSRLVKSRKPVSGLVVSIGVNTNGLAALPPDSVRALIQTLMGPHDFACQAGADEFLLIYPDEKGASAQRRLNRISQRLWDFQLQSLGEAQVLFSWGGVEVSGESIDEAFASASERMRETWRSRKDFALDSSLRQAV